MRKSVDKDPMLLSGELRPAVGSLPSPVPARVPLMRLGGLRAFGLWPALPQPRTPSFSPADIH